MKTFFLILLPFLLFSCEDKFSSCKDDTVDIFVEIQDQLNDDSFVKPTKLTIYKLSPFAKDSLRLVFNDTVYEYPYRFSNRNSSYGYYKIIATLDTLSFEKKIFFKVKKSEKIYIVLITNPIKK